MEEPVEPIRIHQFDGQTLWLSTDVVLYEVGNYLGGGAAGVVYEAENIKTREHYALKILNPLGYKMLPPTLVRRCEVITKGRPVPEEVERGSSGTLNSEHVWWLRNAATRQYIAAYFSERFNALRELNLLQCIDIWTSTPTSAQVDSQGAELMICTHNPDGSMIYTPAIPPKFAEFIRRRTRIFREILNMRKINHHINVIKLAQVLELVQDSKCTIFLVVELADGGELFDRIKVDCGTREENARLYFNQLLAGVRYCHEQGVCHRDLKPENLLLTDGAQGPVLKIADFGFSAHFVLEAMSDEASPPNPSQLNTRSAPNLSSGGQSHSADDMAYSEETPLRVLKSVVGSPFYVAPEVMQADGYDGTKADVWSVGVILYAMLAGNLPFTQDLTTCKRFRHFCKWVRTEESKNSNFLEDPQLEYPKWLFPTRFSAEARSLIVAMLHPTPTARITITEAQRHPWCRNREEMISMVAIPAPNPLVFEVAQAQARNPADEEEEEEEPVEAEVNNPLVVTTQQSRTSEDEGIFSCEMDGEPVQAEPVVTVAQPKPLTSVLAPVFQQRPEVMTPERLLIPALRLDVDPLPKSTPPPAPMAVSIIPPDLLTAGSDEFDDEWSDESSQKRRTGDQDAIAPPYFSDRVKRSTRFVTSVPAFCVLETVEQVLDDCRSSSTATPVGRIGKLDVDRESYRLEVWGPDISGPPLCAVQIYDMQGHASADVASSYSNPEYAKTDSLYMVEFVRGQLEIFQFKRFYQWLRQQIAELVKKDYHLKILEPSAASPMRSSQLLAHFGDSSPVPYYVQQPL